MLKNKTVCICNVFTQGEDLRMVVSNPLWGSLLVNLDMELHQVLPIILAPGLDMYIIKYSIDFDNEAVIKNIDRITNQIFKLLPIREEGGDWQSPLKNLILEITGMKILWVDQTRLFSLLCKMEALNSLNEDEDFLVFRKIIFECLSILNLIKKELPNE